MYTIILLSKIFLIIREYILMKIKFHLHTTLFHNLITLEHEITFTVGKQTFKKKNHNFQYLHNFCYILYIFYKIVIKNIFKFT